MSKGDRLFRGPESHAAEKLSRDALAPFLNKRGYVVIADDRIQTGVATQQFISLRTPDDQVLSMRVRLCWRRDGRNPTRKNTQRLSWRRTCAKVDGPRLWSTSHRETTSTAWVLGVAIRNKHGLISPSSIRTPLQYAWTLNTYHTKVGNYQYA